MGKFAENWKNRTKIIFSEFSKNFNVVMKNWKTFFFAVFEMIEWLIMIWLWFYRFLAFDLWKKFRKNFFSFLWIFLEDMVQERPKIRYFLRKTEKCFFFSEVHPIFWSFFRWCTLERPKMVQNSWKFIFPDFSDNSREKQIFVNFWSFLAILWRITFMADSNLGPNEGILKAF